MSNLTTIPNEEARHEMDELLHDYFQAEMPKPWPAFSAPVTMRSKPAASSWSRYTGRLALAASIAGLVAGYFMLGDYFPRTQAPTGVQDMHRDSAQREKGPKTSTQPKSQAEELPMPKMIGNE